MLNKDELYIKYYKSPIGILEIVTNSKFLLEINFTESLGLDSQSNCECIKNTCYELDEYFKGNLINFSVKILQVGTEFQNNVWNELKKIPYGSVVSYKDVAKNIQSPKAVRAVGNANNKNKIPIIIPCHRVIGSNGKLVGYAGEIWRKEWLINHEAKHRK